MQGLEQPEERMPFVPVQVRTELEDLLARDFAQVRVLGPDGVDGLFDAPQVPRASGGAAGGGGGARGGGGGSLGTGGCAASPPGGRGGSGWGRRSAWAPPGLPRPGTAPRAAG